MCKIFKLRPCAAGEAPFDHGAEGPDEAKATSSADPAGPPPGAGAAGETGVPPQKDAAAPAAVRLDPLRISGEPNMQTPACVLAEIAEMQGRPRPAPRSPQERQALLGEVRGRAAEELAVPLDREALRRLAGYVNGSIRWKWRELWAGYQELEAQGRPFGSKDGPSLGQLRLTVAAAEVGRPEPGKSTLTASFLFRLLAWLGAPLPISSTPADLKELAVAHLAGYGAFCSALQLLRASADPGEGMVFALPLTAEVAIKLASGRMGLDLGWAGDALVAFYELSAKGLSGEVAALRARNSRLCELDHVFNPALSYTKPQLRAFAKALGLPGGASQKEVADATAGETFWPGWFPTIGNEQTPFALDEVAKLPPEELICFGRVRERLAACSFAELADFLAAQEVPCVPPAPAPAAAPPAPAAPMTPAQVRRLRALVREAPFSEAKRRIAAELGRLADRVTKDDAAVGGLRAAYAVRPKEVAAFLEQLFVLAMTMRGWSGRRDEALPLAEVRNASESTVEIRTWRAIALLEGNAKACGADVQALPLVQHLGETYVRYTSPGGGATIRERLEIVEHDKANIHSCIRMTSNMMGWAALYYMEMLGLKRPIRVEEMKTVA